MSVKVRDVALRSLGAVSIVLACVTQCTSTRPASAPSAEAPLVPISDGQAATAPSAIEPPPSVASTQPASPPASASAAPLPPARPAAVQPASTPAGNRAKPPPSTEKDCKACNGDWGIHGLARTPSCNCRTTDGGKRCRDGTECQGLCVASDTPERDVVDKGPPARGFFVGRCTKFSTVYGCYRPIDDGASARPVDLSEPPHMICAD